MAASARGLRVARVVEDAQVALARAPASATPSRSSRTPSAVDSWLRVCGSPWVGDPGVGVGGGRELVVGRRSRSRCRRGGRDRACGRRRRTGRSPRCRRCVGSGRRRGRRSTSGASGGCPRRAGGGVQAVEERPCRARPGAVTWSRRRGVPIRHGVTLRAPSSNGTVCTPPVVRRERGQDEVEPDVRQRPRSGVRRLERIGAVSLARAVEGDEQDRVRARWPASDMRRTRPEGGRSGPGPPAQCSVTVARTSSSVRCGRWLAHVMGHTTEAVVAVVPVQTAAPAGRAWSTSAELVEAVTWLCRVAGSRPRTWPLARRVADGVRSWSRSEAAPRLVLRGPGAGPGPPVRVRACRWPRRLRRGAGRGGQGGVTSWVPVGVAQVAGSRAGSTRDRCRRRGWCRSSRRTS